MSVVASDTYRVASSGVAHRNNFNLIRLLAAIQVMVVHTLNHFEVTGYAVDALKIVPGVPVFFFISGYLIGGSYIRTHGRGLSAYAANRALRIFPALWVCVVLSTLSVFAMGYMACISVNPFQLLVWVAGQASFLQFYNPEFMRGYGAGVLNGALWTISVELQFYILAPLIFLAFMRVKILAAAVFVVSIVANIYFREFANWDSFVNKIVYVTFLPWVYMFMVGFAVAYWRPIQAWLLKVPYVVLILAYVASMFLIGNYTINAQNSINPLSFLLIAALIFKLGYARIPLADDVNDFVRRNDFSYGIYLFHMPVINAFLYAGAGLWSIWAIMAVTILLGVASWYLVERPALSFKR
ncbi:acyltransferase family protein [Devosia sediminis]|uniref:Acyltransferase n=1 Tax=Devosia sediminis TaxID=2798801 RepID=A0A934IZZ2_9HYPH|nr:acyltransferase [Devosia sediminis]MBJ3785069.1 acyltransferase [Devosia sediminis]